MDNTEKVIIACYLLDEGLDGKSVAGFIEALALGLDEGETDALRMRNAFLKRPAAGLPKGDLGRVVAIMVASRELKEVERRVSTISKDFDLLRSLTASDQPHELAARVAVRRLSEIIALPAGA